MRRRTKIVLAIPLVLILGLLASWGGLTSWTGPICIPGAADACRTIDGFPIGRLIEDCPCSDADDSEAIAVAGLDARDASHSAVARTTIFALDDVRVCGQQLCTRSDGYEVFVFDLQDGSERAIGVECGVDGCQAHTSYR